MSLYYCIEDEYRNTPWCSETLEGLYTEIKRQKYAAQEVEDISALPVPNGSERSSVIIIGSLKSWISEKISQTSKHGMFPIVLSDSPVEDPNKSYSTVSSDVYGAVRTAIAAARNSGKGRIALYGINPHSISDTLRKKAFIKLGCRPEDIYNNHGSLEDCFYDFFPSIEHHDTVICANDFAAVSLVTRLKKMNYDFSRLYIISCNDGLLLKYISPSVTAFSRNFKAFGKAAISLHKVFTKSPDIAFADAHIKYTLNIRETTPDLVSCCEVGPPISEEGRSFFSIYEDGELLDIMMVEKLLRDDDGTNMKILSLLHKKYTYESIAETLFISRSAVKYRLRSLCMLTEVSSPKELLEIVSRYYPL